MDDQNNRICELENEVCQLKKELESAKKEIETNKRSHTQAQEIIQNGVEINEALLSLQETVSTILDRDEMLRRVSGVIPKVVDAERCSIFLWSDEQNAFLPVYITGMPQELKALFFKIKLQAGIPLADSILSGERIIIDDYR